MDKESRIINNNNNTKRKPTNDETLYNAQEEPLKGSEKIER
jgi:hypothetical protein